jgi:hypothetical protein
MSILPMNFDRTLEHLAHPGGVQVYDVSGQYESGIWVRTRQPDRTIDATIVMADPETLNVMEIGDASVGAIAIHTRDKLYFHDAKAAVQENRQSFIVYKNYIYRVLQRIFQQATFRSYLAVRYMEHGADSETI